MKLANIEGLSKPTSVAPTIKRANQYLKVMKDMGKPVSSVSIAAKHYDTALASVNKDLAPHEKYTGLCIGPDVTVLRGAA